jgi:hypothetical protein
VRIERLQAAPELHERPPERKRHRGRGARRAKHSNGALCLVVVFLFFILLKKRLPKSGGFTGQFFLK